MTAVQELREAPVIMHTPVLRPAFCCRVLLLLLVLQGPVGKGNLARFLWNVMALVTSSNTTGAVCDPFDKQCPAGQVGGVWVKGALGWDVVVGFLWP
jgi:hypothetical protein